MIDFYILKYPKYKEGDIVEFQYLCGDEKTDCHPYTSVLSPGTYIFEVYGAEGGKGNSERGGFGGYSRGIFTTKKQIKTYLYVGAKGLSTTSDPKSTSPTSFNGGGSGQNSQDDGGFYASSGGGASDIRLLKDDLFHRVIVAGGGGGSGFYNQQLIGGNGGGKEGKGGQQVDHPFEEVYSEGGKQTGKTTYFGYGENMTKTDGCGGGGGWYGGTAGEAYVNPGGGGSGFVFTYNNKDTADQANLQLESEHYLVDASTNENERTGDGFIQITIVNFIKFNICITSQFHFNFRSFCSIMNFPVFPNFKITSE